MSTHTLISYVYITLFFLCRFFIASEKIDGSGKFRKKKFLIHKKVFYLCEKVLMRIMGDGNI